jgi:hypothetical protein
VKRRTGDVGLEGDFGGHSLRSGLATSAARAGKTEEHHAARTMAERAGSVEAARASSAARRACARSSSIVVRQKSNGTIQHLDQNRSV